MKKQNRDSNGRYSKISKTAKIYGNSKGGPWDDRHLGLGNKHLNYYFLVKTKNDFYFYDPVSGLTDTFHLNFNIINQRIKSGIWTEIPYSVLQHEFPNQMADIDAILGISKHNIEDQVVVKLTIDDIKIGSLYYNLVYQVVERVIDIQGRLIYTSYHKMECNPFGVHSFRKATKAEIDNYLQESEEIKD